ncbi:FIST signal transduction protein [Aquabacterium sp.]|uniref:FIST signal transduction protein n=1 Tax=Aquabacterium sp. TaxID=1872578 RepID=UPI0035B2753D
MQIGQSLWTTSSGWRDVHQLGAVVGPDAQLVLLFGGGARLRDAALVSPLRARFPQAALIGCSTAGEICGEHVLDDSLVAVAVRFEHTRVRKAHTRVQGAPDSHAAGARLARDLAAPDLRHVLVLSDGLTINGTALAAGLRESLPPAVAVTGGLAGDGARFEHTCLRLDDDVIDQGVAAVGLYGERLQVGYGSVGGWDSFGPARVITRSQGNVLYELDGCSALDLYKQYLGEHAANLPASALLFPLAVDCGQGQSDLVRTVLSVDESNKSMTFAGDMPQGAHARLMKANFDRLIDGAAGAAQVGLQRLGSFQPQLALLVSCVGRKLVLRQRVEEEVESVRAVLGPAPILTGFYSYGEICPQGTLGRCELHNQTMTVTTFVEA